MSNDANKPPSSAADGEDSPSRPPLPADLAFPQEPEPVPPSAEAPSTGDSAEAEERKVRVRKPRGPKRVPVVAVLALVAAAVGAAWVAGMLLSDPAMESSTPQMRTTTGTESPELAALRRALESELELGEDPMVVDLRQRLLRNPEDLEALLTMGYVHVQRKEYDKARGYYLYASQVDPRSLEARTHLGTTAYFLGNIEEALHHYDQVLALDPDYTVALFEMGAVLRFGKNDLPAAIRTWERFLELDPDAEEARQVRELVAEAKRMVDSGEWKPPAPHAKPEPVDPETLPWPGQSAG
ncbi:MAG: tetratricopeptide repeat protein [Nitrospirota bacterium]|nr:tetratricopeptide repeat protein [Nitrospirota bacterium]